MLGMAPGGAVESKLGSNPSHIGVTFTRIATETNEPTRFVRALSDGFALVCKPGLVNTRATNRRP